MPKDSQTTLYLIRHADTAWSQNGRHTGSTDLPLLPEGEKKAQASAPFFSLQGFSSVFISPLIRAKETCRLVGLHGIVEEDLREWNYGDYEGLTTEEIQRQVPGWNIFTHGAKGGESTSAVSARAERFLKKIEGIQGKVAIFSSGHFLRVLTSRWLKTEISFGKFFTLYPMSVSILGHEKQDRVIIQWNDIVY